MREERERGLEMVEKTQRQINLAKARKARRAGISMGSMKDPSKPSVFGKNKDSILSAMMPNQIQNVDFDAI